MISKVGETTGDVEMFTGFPSGIVCGNVTVFVTLLVLFSSPFVDSGEVGEYARASLLGDIMDSDIRDGIGRAGRPFDIAVAFCVRTSIGIALAPSDGPPYKIKSVSTFPYGAWHSLCGVDLPVKGLVLNCVGS